MSKPTEKLEAVFEAALALETAAQRSDYLGRACPEPELRREVEALLAAHAKPDTIFEDKTRRVDPPPSEAAGTVIGRYKLLEALGEGGFDSVWLAEQKEPVRRKVALKVVKLGMDTRQVVARFEAERQALALMDHPNIAKVLDAGTTEQGRPYFVMELVRGIPITKFCDENKLATRERLDLFIKVCHAVQHAHQKGVIHRDLKPSNVLVTLHDGVPVPKVIDFGIAKATQQELTEKTIHTQFHQFVGTPAYVSPEQAEMSGLDIDTRSDIYSLGVLLYELLTGRTPFDGKELLASGLDEMRRIIREVEPQRPSTRLDTLDIAAATTLASQRHEKLPTLVNLVRGDLDWIAMKCLEKDRARRYETASGLAADLKRHLGNEPVTARPPSQLYRLQKAYRRNRLAFTAAACVLVATVIAMIFIWVAGQREGLARVRESIQRNLAEQRRVEAEANEKRAVAAQAGEVKQRKQAEAQELVARQQAYAADMNLAQQALALNNLGRAQMLLHRHKPQPGQQDLRGWEWRYLWGQGRSDAVFNFTENKNLVSSLAVSPDGQRIATGNRLSLIDATGPVVSLFDWQTRQRVTPDPGKFAGAYLAFSPQAPVLAFPMQSNGLFNVRLWDATTSKVIGDLPLGGPAGRLAFSADGKTLVTATEPPDSQLTLWRIPEGTPIKSHSIGRVTPQGCQAPLAIARDVGVAAYAADDRPLVIQVIDLATGQARWTASCANHVQALAFSHDGKILASGEFGNEATIRLWDAATGRPIGRPLEGHRAWVSELVFWPDGKMLASASADQTIRLWDLTDPANVLPIRTLQGHKYEVWSLALMPDHRHLLSGSKDGELLVWDTAAARTEKGLVRLPEKLWTWSFAPDSKSVLTVDQQGRVLRRMGDSFRITDTLIEAGTNISSAVISPDGRLAATGSTNGVVQVWDLQERTLLSTVPHSTGKVIPIGLRPKTKSLFVYRADDSSIREWDLVGMAEIRSWLDVPREPRWAPTLSTTSDDQWRLLVQYGGWGRLRNMASGEEWPLTRAIEWSSTSVLSPNGMFMADASRLGFVMLWNRDAGTMREQHTFARFMLGAHSVAFTAR